MFNPELLQITRLFDYNRLYDCDRIHLLPDSCSGRDDSTMSLAIGMIGIDGIVLATDSRKMETMGELKNIVDNSKKLWAFQKYRLGITAVSNDEPFSNWLLNKIPAILEREDVSSLGYEEKMDKISIELSRLYKQYIREHAFSIEGNFQWGMDFMIAGFASPKKPRLLDISAQISKAGFVPRYYQFQIQGIIAQAFSIFGNFRELLYKRVNDIEIPVQNVEILRKVATLIIDECSLANNVQIGGGIQMIVIKPNGRITSIKPSDSEILRDKIRKTVTNRNNMFDRLMRVSV